MSIGSAISGIGGLIGSSKGADAAQNGAAQAAAASKEMFNTGLSFEVPWIDQGAGYRAPINDTLLGGSTGTGTYAGGGVNDMGGAGSRQNGYAGMYTDPFIPRANTGTNVSPTTNSSPGHVVEGPGFQPAPGAPVPGWQDSLGYGSNSQPFAVPGPGTPYGTGSQPFGTPGPGIPYSTNGTDTTGTATGTTTGTTTATDPNAVQGTAYTGSNALGMLNGSPTTGGLSFGSTTGGAGYGTVGLGRVNLSYNPTDWNTFASNYSMSPAAQYQMGINDASVNNSAAARGGLLSSGDLRNLMTTNEGIVSQDMYKEYGSMLQGQQQDYSQRLASMGLLQGQEQVGANASNAVMTGAVSSGNSQASAISAGAQSAAHNYANMFSGFGSGGQNLFGSGGIFSSGNTAA